MLAEADVGSTMNTNRAIRTAVLAALVAVPISSVPAAGPFQVRRATTAEAVSAAPSLATIETSPYDGDAASFGSETSYYYAVHDAAGAALDISVQTNPATRTIRIGFDDANAASAAVDAASPVVVAPTSIRADGLQFSSITIVPRDVNGVLLGRGLVVAIDGSLLWPARLSGPIVDAGDGSYLALAVASVPGIGSVRVVVESAVLAALPTITAVPLGPMSLRDLAIAELQGLSGPGGPLSSLLAQTGAGSEQGQRIAAAITAANAALATLVNGDVLHDDNVVKTSLDAVLYQLASVVESPGALDPLDLRDTMDDLFCIARLIAEWHLERATAACGTCDGAGAPNKVCDAAAAMANADAMRAAVSPDWRRTVDKYARVIALALQAVQTC